MSRVTLITADVLAGLAQFPDNHFSSCVTDPPYELGFMGKKWDSSGISYDVEMWRQVFRVLKPGAYLLAFGGSRTYHRLACAIEDAGFEIRDQIMWIYGSGFPKSLDVSKGIDKAAGAERKVVGFKKSADGRCRSLEPSGQQDRSALLGGGIKVRTEIDTAPATDPARQWDGWGTALKPAHEPIVVARKPLEGKVIVNVLKHGTGAINVAGCQVQYVSDYDAKHQGDIARGQNNATKGRFFGGKGKSIASSLSPAGRWPANVIHDGSDEVLAEFEKAGERPSGAMKKPYTYKNNGFSMGAPSGETRANHDSNSGSAARFFYCAKASQEERNRGLESSPPKIRHTYNDFQGTPDHAPKKNVQSRNNHPTVKPLALMAYLVRLVTPPGGLVLDPFMGSGSTLIAAAKEGFDAVGIDKEAAYIEISRKRIAGELGMLADIELLEAP